MTEAQKKKLMPAIVLTAICLVVALALAAVNLFTAPIVEENTRKKEQESLQQVMTDGVGFTLIEGLNLPETVKSVYREDEGRGFVLLLSTSSQYTSSGEPMNITVGIDKEGTITGILLTSYSESKDFGKESYPATYVGKDETLQGVELVAGVTYSSTAFRDAVKDAFRALTEGGLLTK